MRIALRSVADWCRCGGQGFWYEQIDGPHNLRRVRCLRHEDKGNLVAPVRLDRGLVLLTAE